jgi:hypothetical protein
VHNRTRIRRRFLKMEIPQVVYLRGHVELEGIEPSTSSMPWNITVLEW